MPFSAHYSPLVMPAGPLSALQPPHESPPLPAELERQFCRRFDGAFGASGVGRRVFARAPGRVNLIGEHTDYSGGLVLPSAIDRHTWALAARRDDSRVRVWTRELDRCAEFDALAPRRAGDWSDYIRAVVVSLSARGVPGVPVVPVGSVGGFDLALASTLPTEAGLSSSAALGVAVATALDRLFELGLDAVQRAQVVHRGENEFVGTGCGILDQFASALGQRDHALRIDCRTQEVTPVPLPPGIRILIAHSGVTRALARGDYRERVTECERALAAAQSAGVTGAQSNGSPAMSLRDFSTADLPALESALDGVLFRRARHVISENARVDAFCAALSQRDAEPGRPGELAQPVDLAKLSELLAQGQNSLRDDFEVSIEELDVLCELANQLPGVVGSRLTGAGFGGCTVHLITSAFGSDEGEALREEFAKRFGRVPALWIARASDGAKVLDEAQTATGLD